VLDELLIGLLLYGVFPLWVAAGFADYCCHRVTRIEHTTGRVESWLHAAQYVQIVAGVVLSLFLDVTSLVLVLVIGLALLHLATGYVDIAYTTGRRHISPLEQHVHSYMEVLPLAATALLVILYWDPFAAIFDDAAASWTWTRRQQPLPAGALAAIAAGIALAGCAIAEEYFRCVRRGGAATHPPAK
jgi:ABC-type amino acid transport system permease subunit